MNKILTFFVLAVIIDICTAGCGSTKRLPPIGNAPVATDTVQNDTPTDQQSGARQRIPISSSEANQVASYISGKPMTILSNNLVSACFTDFIACSGKYKNTAGVVKTASMDDQCDFNIIGNKVSLTVWDSNDKLLYEFLVTAPASYIPPPTVIQDASGKLTLNQTCTL